MAIVRKKKTKSPMTLVQKLAVILPIMPNVPPTTTVPVRVTGPAAMTARNALTTYANPMFGVAGIAGRRIAPANPASPEPSAKVMVFIREDSIPIADAVSPS